MIYIVNLVYFLHLNLIQLYFRYLYLDARALKFLTHVLPSLHEKSEDVSISIDTIVTLVMSHSSFLTVMFNEESPESKGLHLRVISLLPSVRLHKIEILEKIILMGY